MKNEKNAQSTLETIAFLVLVMVGIMVIGPNVVRSVNAFFKGAQEQAEESFREEFTQANLIGPENNYRLGDCHCAYDTNHTCGDGTDCAWNRWMYSLTGCSAACQAEWRAANFLPAAQCDDEGSLASQGRTPFSDCFPTPEDYPKTAADFDTQVLNGTCGWGCCFPGEIVAPPQCGATPATDGKILMLRRCGPFQEAQYFWEDSSFCAYECLGTKDNNSAWCSASYNYGLVADKNMEFVDYEDADSGLTGCEKYALDNGCFSGDIVCYEQQYKCLVRCPSGLIGTSMGCGCPATMELYNNQCCPKSIYIEPAIHSDCGSCERREASYDLAADLSYAFAPLHQSQITNIYFYDEWSGETVPVYPKNLSVSFWAFQAGPNPLTALELVGNFDVVTNSCAENGLMDQAIYAAGSSTDNHTEAYTGKPLFDSSGYLTGFKFVGCSPDHSGDKGVHAPPHITIIIRYVDCGNFLP